LCETPFAAQRRQILRETHEPLYRLRRACWYVILIVSV
jgi:hypothetical protein